MPKIILLAVAGYVWKKLKESRAATPAGEFVCRPEGEPPGPIRPSARNFS